MVIDAFFHNDGQMICVMVRVLGAVGRQVRGCRRLTIYDAVFEAAGTTVDLLLTDQSVVIAHGLCVVSSCMLDLLALVRAL